MSEDSYGDESFSEEDYNDDFEDDDFESSSRSPALKASRSIAPTEKVMGIESLGELMTSLDTTLEKAKQSNGSPQAGPNLVKPKDGGEEECECACSCTMGICGHC